MVNKRITMSMAMLVGLSCHAHSNQTTTIAVTPQTIVSYKKTIDPFGIIERELLLEPLTATVNEVISPHFPKAKVSAFVHQTNPEDMITGHSAAVRIQISDKSVSIGEVNAVLQPVLERVYSIRELIFSFYQQFHSGQITLDELQDITTQQLVQLKVNKPQIAKINQHVTSIKPTQAMLEAWTEGSIEGRIPLPDNIKELYTNRDLTPKELHTMAVLTLTKIQLQDQNLELHKCRGRIFLECRWIRGSLRFCKG